ncbi:hypothetical protein BEWA_028190 [Theileria equi strain WA]|uniref:Uncharacterized protein n=1 Tax=Theileria equi strain WA TaxID=1537102 RepID=L0AWQ1_THEEQ|nr:hypothetical protein BEWA_028190 [Theileria equi strain WA]AFZ79970.1 hypothetical protein BEWA_028190 [Theileria equi strain WA]|eukprot:XP_004829636.1 hypothetical protein BEWA_028190 [Theileria equi strain WA]
MLKSNHMLMVKKYYYEDEHGEWVEITLVERVPDLPEYKALKYEPGTLATDISSIEYNLKLVNVRESLDEYTSVTVYYWSGDKIYNNPLLLELNKINEEKYYSYDGSDWKDESIVSASLLDTLNKLKKVHFPDTGLSTGAIAGMAIASGGIAGSTGGGTIGTGLTSLGIWKKLILLLRLSPLDYSLVGILEC